MMSSQLPNQTQLSSSEWPVSRDLSGEHSMRESKPDSIVRYRGGVP
jgi:hypothetical protein